MSSCVYRYRRVASRGVGTKGVSGSQATSISAMAVAQSRADDRVVTAAVIHLASHHGRYDYN